MIHELGLGGVKKMMMDKFGPNLHIMMRSTNATSKKHYRFYKEPIDEYQQRYDKQEHKRKKYDPISVQNPELIGHRLIYQSGLTQVEILKRK